MIFHSTTTTSHSILSKRVLILPLVATGILIAAILWRMALPAQPKQVQPLVPIDSASSAATTQLKNRLQRNPEDPDTYAQLGISFLLQVRESGDSSLYAKAGQAFDEALQRDPNNGDALMGQGMLSAALHDFPAALAWAEKAQALNPWRAETIGILVDGYVELGLYEEAVAAAQQMVDLRPSLDSYSRVSYLRELYGDVDGAIVAMQAAVDAGVPGTESRLWSQVQLGHLYFNRGDLENAQAIYESALSERGDYIHAQAGLARIQAAKGDYENAISAYETITQRLPLPEYLVMLGDLYEVTGQTEKATQPRELVHVIQKLNASAGMNVDLELAYFDVEYGDDAAAALANVQAAYDRRPTIYAADAVAWALYKNGRFAEAETFSHEALRLGTQDATMHYHASLIARALGDDADAELYMQKTQTINPYFSIRHQL